MLISLCFCCSPPRSHLASCGVLMKVWKKFHVLVVALVGPTPLTEELIFHAVDTDGQILPPGLSALHLIMWKFVIYNFTMVQLENRPFNPEEVWKCAIRRFEVRLNALAFKVKQRAIRRSGQGINLMSPEAENRRMRPLASVGMWGKLYPSSELEKEFKSTRQVPTVPTAAAGQAHT